MCFSYPQKIETADRTAEIECKLQELLDLVGIGAEMQTHRPNPHSSVRVCWFTHAQGSRAFSGYLVKRWGGDAADVVAEELGWDHIARDTPPQSSLRCLQTV